jgi:hypothetical protein
MIRLFSLLMLMLGSSAPAAGADSHWVVSWTGSAHGPYPSGNSLAQPT